MKRDRLTNRRLIASVCFPFVEQMVTSRLGRGYSSAAYGVSDIQSALDFCGSLKYGGRGVGLHIDQIRNNCSSVLDTSRAIE